jgi:hypothetical protein
MKSTKPNNRPDNQITNTTLSLNVTPDTTEGLQVSQPFYFNINPNKQTSSFSDWKINSEKFDNKELEINNKVSYY